MTAALWLWLVMSLTATPSPLVTEGARNEFAKAVLAELVKTQQALMIQHRINDLPGLYGSNWAAQQALKVSQVRSQYLNAWARLRRIDWTGITVTVRTPSIAFVTNDRIRFYAVEREQYHYRYQSLPKTPLWFGIASRHHLSIEHTQQGWRFYSDDFTNPVLPNNIAGQQVPQQVGGLPPRVTLSPNRQQAVNYANQYCGNAPGCGNDGHYNSAYRNYNGIGGDCTNWISQVLHAGGFPMTSVWRYDQTTDEGSDAWANARNLAEFLKSSGRATLFSVGSYEAVTRPTASWPYGAIETLEPGDLISYQEHGHIVHTAVVVGYDPKGVVLTNAHTNDRYHVPWDFGWSDGTTFYLWHVHYPSGSPRPRASAPTRQSSTGWVEYREPGHNPLHHQARQDNWARRTPYIALNSRPATARQRNSTRYPV
ncbi:MAG: amidase domain-containing protein [Firmicutes bacterium]|nr:amidase domain-containing protein [Bacillota bacterium]